MLLEIRGGRGYEQVVCTVEDLWSGNGTQDVQVRRADSTVQPPLLTGQRQGCETLGRPHLPHGRGSAVIPQVLAEEGHGPGPLVVWDIWPQRKLSVVHHLLCGTAVLGKPSFKRGINVLQNSTITWKPFYTKAQNCHFCLHIFAVIYPTHSEYNLKEAAMDKLRNFVLMWRYDLKFNLRHQKCSLPLYISKVLFFWFCFICFKICEV